MRLNRAKEDSARGSFITPFCNQTNGHLQGNLPKCIGELGLPNKEIMETLNPSNGLITRAGPAHSRYFFFYIVFAGKNAQIDPLKYPKQLPTIIRK